MEKWEQPLSKLVQTEWRTGVSEFHWQILKEPGIICSGLSWARGYNKNEMSARGCWIPTEKLIWPTAPRMDPRLLKPISITYHLSHSRWFRDGCVVWGEKYSPGWCALWLWSWEPLQSCWHHEGGQPSPWQAETSCPWGQHGTTGSTSSDLNAPCIARMGPHH